MTKRKKYSIKATNIFNNDCLFIADASSLILAKMIKWYYKKITKNWENWEFTITENKKEK